MKTSNRRHFIAVSWLSLITSLMLVISPANASEPAFNAADYKGKVLYVDFWASWCTPCRAAFPFMRDLKTEFGDDLVIAAINLDKRKSDAQLFLEDFDVNFQVFYDPDGKLAEEYGLKGMPTSYLYGRDGTLIGDHVGFRKKDIKKLHAKVAEALQ